MTCGDGPVLFMLGATAVLLVVAALALLDAIYVRVRHHWRLWQVRRLIRATNKRIQARVETRRRERG